MDIYNTPEQDYIIDHLGADDWAQVCKEFSGMMPARVRRTLLDMYPTEDNRKLARMIIENVPRRIYLQRDFTFRMRLNDAERVDLAQRAEVAGQSQSEYVRRLIWPPQN